MPALMRDVGRSDKAAWAGEAARRIPQASREGIEDITAFFQEIDRYLVGVVQEWATSGDGGLGHP
jgi:hypothetical protein